MSHRTVFFAVALIDRYVATLSDDNSLRTLNSQLLGSTCLHLASKCEDVTYIGIRDLVVQGLQVVTPAPNVLEMLGKEILDLEEKVLNALKFDLYLPTTIDFVNVYTDCVPEFHNNKLLTIFVKYIAESSLLYSPSLNFMPSHLAASAVAYSLNCWNNGNVKAAWSNILETITQYTLEDLKACMKVLCDMHKLIPRLAFKTVFKRYKAVWNIQAVDVQ